MKRALAIVLSIVVSAVAERWVYIVDHASAEPAAADSPKKE